MRSGAAIAAVGPVAATVIALVFAGLELAGRSPLSYAPPANIAEAAGMGIGAEVLRFLRAGEDPAAQYRVRPDIISSRITRVTALEAAVWSRRVELVRMLDRQGALNDHETRARLACLASAIRIEPIQQYLAPDAAPSCDTAAVVRAIEARKE